MFHGLKMFKICAYISNNITFKYKTIYIYKLNLIQLTSFLTSISNDGKTILSADIGVLVIDQQENSIMVVSMYLASKIE